MWLAFTLAVVACTSVLGILFRVVAVKSKDPRIFSFLMNATALIIVALLVIVKGMGKVSLENGALVLILLSGLGYGFFQRFQFLVRKHIEASKISVIFAPTGFVGYTLAILWLGESVTPLKLAGYALIFLAILLILYKKSSEKIVINRYVVIALFIGAGLSCAATIDRSVVPGFESALTYTLIIWASQTLACFVPGISMKHIKTELRINTYFIPLLAVINVAATFFLVSALQRAPATQVMPIANSNVIVTALLGILLLKERDRIGTKLLAAIIATVGLILVSQ